MEPKPVNPLSNIKQSLPKAPAERVELQGDLTQDEIKEDPEVKLIQDEPALSRQAHIPNVLVSTTDHTPGKEEDVPFSLNLAGMSLIGATINNRYFIESKIARGGMGTVYKAIDKQENRIVAIKILNAASSDQINPRLVERFLREGHTMNRLKHKNILECYEFNEEGPYLVMELIQGGNLKCPISPLAPEQKILVIADICDGLQYAHQNKLVHRDVKPGNILLSTEATKDKYLTRPTAKLADFGLVMIPDATRVTKSGDIMGSAVYMSPEQASGKRQLVSGLSDLYSIGIILYEIVTGQVPFNGDGEFLVVLQQHQSANPVPISDYPLKTLPGLEPIIMTLLQKNPSHRFYKEAKDLANALRNVIHPRKTSVKINPPPE